MREVGGRRERVWCKRQQRGNRMEARLVKIRGYTG
jgi:hypothetical protein